MKKHKKLLCWIYGLCFVIVWLFPGKALSQSNNPREIARCSFNAKYSEYESWDHEILPVDFYPWGVCMNRSRSMQAVIWGEHTTYKEDRWIRDAMGLWNEAYYEYKKLIWGTADMVRIPAGRYYEKLFVEECDRSSGRNIIYVIKKDITALGEYSSYDDWWDFMNFFFCYKNE